MVRVRGLYLVLLCLSLLGCVTHRVHCHGKFEPINERPTAAPADDHGG